MVKVEKLNRRLQWFKMTGHFLNGMECEVIAYVEATSKNKVLRYHGGKQEVYTGTIVEFPTERCEVQVVGRQLQDNQIDEEQDAIVEVIIPASRYHCDCGKEYVSEHPYPSVWCSCGKKVPQNIN